MFRYLSIASILLLFSLLCSAKNNPGRPIYELQSLISKSGNDTNRISLLLEEGMLYVLRPGSEKHDMDSATLLTDRAMKLSQSLGETRWVGRCELVYSNIFREKGEIETGKDHIQKAITTLSQHGTNGDLGDGYKELALYYSPYGDSADFDNKLRFNEDAARFYKQAEEDEQYAGILYNLAELYEMAENYSKATDSIQKALAIYQKIGHAEKQYAYDLLGAIYRTTGNYQQALNNGFLAVQTAITVNDTTIGLCAIYNRLGLVYNELKQYSEAIPYFQKAMSVAVKYNDKGNILVVTRNLLTAYYETGQTAKAINEIEFVEKQYKPVQPRERLRFLGIAAVCYASVRKYDIARKYYLELSGLSASMAKDNDLQLLTYPYLARYCLITGNYDEACKYCKLADWFNLFYRHAKNLSDNYHIWSEADSGLGNYAAALLHYQMYTTIKDSLFNEAKVNQIAQLQIKYETDEKAQNIQLLTRQAQLQQAKMRQTKVTKNVFLGGAIALSLLLGLGYNRYRLKQRSNTQLEAQRNEINIKNESLQQLLKEKEWLVKEIHHRVKNNLQIVMSLLSTQSSLLDNTEAAKAISESQHRMQAMSLIHQKLYQSENVSIVDMEQYIYELIGYLAESYDTGTRIQFFRDVDNLKLDVAQAIPIGLILNEAVTNSIKYAFPGRGNGHINISLKCTPGNNLLLNITDNGVGLERNYDIIKGNSLGINLVRGLAKQLDGSFAIKNSNGLGIQIEFPYVAELNENFGDISSNSSKT